MFVRNLRIISFLDVLITLFFILVLFFVAREFSYFFTYLVTSYGPISIFLNTNTMFLLALISFVTGLNYYGYQIQDSKNIKSYVYGYAFVDILLHILLGPIAVLTLALLYVIFQMSYGLCDSHHFRSADCGGDYILSYKVLMLDLSFLLMMSSYWFFYTFLNEVRYKIRESFDQ